MELLVLPATLSFILMAGAVGTKLMLVARRTRRLPELTVGLGLFLVAFVGYPLILVSLAESLEGGPGRILYAAGTLATMLGSASIFVFTWKVFRPDAAWARLVTGAAIAILAGFAVHTLWRLAVGSEPADIYRDRISTSRSFVTGFCYVWTAVESFRYRVLLRRREAVGLGDPVVANRFLLWGLAGVAATGGTAFSTWLAFAGPSASGPHPMGLLAVGVAGVVATVSLYLAFLPPRAWLRFVAGEGAAAGS